MRSRTVGRACANTAYHQPGPVAFPYLVVLYRFFSIPSAWPSRPWTWRNQTPASVGGRLSGERLTCLHREMLALNWVRSIELLSAHRTIRCWKGYLGAPKPAIFVFGAC